MKASRYLLVPLLLLLIITGELSAQSNVESRVQKLEETVRVLERRVTHLEDQSRESSTPTPTPSGKANWRKLQKGLSENDVEKLLGSPSKVDVFGPVTIWRYGNSLGGVIQFDSKSRTVTGWNEP